MNEDVRLEAFYPHPPECVWQALTEAGALGRWLMPTNFEPVIGFRFRLTKPDGSKINGKVTDVEEGRLLAYTWDDEDGQASLVAWQLTPKDGGTELRLQHMQIEEPEVNCLAIDRYFNWRYALLHRLPGLLALLAAQEHRLVVIA
jgi:uncharacterized protein YndB with AHSA1/START domain